MKIARYLSMALLGIFLVTTRAGAAPLASTPVADPYTQYDPDGVPMSVTLPQARQLSQEEINTLHKQQERAAYEKNWLVRGYEQQLQSHASANSPADQDANLFYQLSSNRDLAKLAGLSPLDFDSDSPGGTTAYRTGASPSNQGAVTLRSDAPSAATSGFLSHGYLFKPLVTPLSEPDAAGLHNFYSPLPIAMASPLYADRLPKTPPAPKADLSQDSSDLETPGLIAAKKDPLTDTSVSDLNLDVLPGESIEQARAHQDDYNKLELPLPMDATQLHKEQTAALSAPSVTNAAPTAPAAPAPAKALPVENPDDTPMPVNSIPPINPVRSPIANPYDILNH